MRIMHLALLGLLLALPAAGAHAQSAADHYHDAARLYVAGQDEPAERAALAGLALDPGDARLQALLARIRQEQPPQPGGQDDESEQDQSAQDDPARQAEDGAERPDDQAASDRPQGEQPDPADGAPEAEDEGYSGRPDARRPGEGGATPQGDAPVEPGRMSRAEAERILRAVGADEERLLQRMQRQRARPRHVEKDW